MHRVSRYRSIWLLQALILTCASAASPVQARHGRLQGSIGRLLGFDRTKKKNTLGAKLSAKPLVKPAVKSPVRRNPSQSKPRKPSSNFTAENVPQAILPNGRSVPPTSWHGGYHGTSTIPPEIALVRGLPGRGDDLRLQEHSESKSHSAFRGLTEFVSDPVSGNGAAYWADEGGWVYEVRGVPIWDVNTLLEGRVPTPNGFRGNLMYGESELATLAAVPPERIKAWGRVEADSQGRLAVLRWYPNPAYRDLSPSTSTSQSATPVSLRLLDPRSIPSRRDPDDAAALPKRTWAARPLSRSFALAA
jgi:hypothetical protein